MTDTDTTPTERSMLPAQGSMEAFERLRTDMMDVAENFWRGAPLPWMSTPAWPLANGWGPMNPPVDMSETDDAYVVTAELPGLKKDDVVVEADNQLLTISGSKEDEHKSVRKHHQYAERRFDPAPGRRCGGCRCGVQERRADGHPAQARRCGGGSQSPGKIIPFRV